MANQLGVQRSLPERLAQQDDSNSWPAPLRDLWDASERLLHFPEYQRYRIRSVDLLLAAHIVHREVELPEPERDAFADVKARRIAKSPIRVRRRLRFFGSPPGFQSAPFFGALWIAGALGFGILSQFKVSDVLLIALAAGILYLSSLWLRRLLRFRPHIESPRVDLGDPDRGAARRSYRLAIATTAVLSLNTAISRSDEFQGAVVFTSTAPQLTIEDLRGVVPGQSYRYLKSFLDAHTTCAVGIAGRRGAGKSTTLSYLHGMMAGDGISVLIPSPVKFDPTELLRRVLFEVSRQIGGGDIATRDTEARRVRKWRITARLLRVGGALAVGAALALVLFPSVLASIWEQTLPYVVPTAVGLVGLIAIAASTFRPHLRSRWRANEFAADGERLARYDMESTLQREGTFTIPGAALKAGGSRSERLSRRHPTALDFASSLRDLLLAYTGETGQRVQILIDELDKVSEVDDLIVSVNELKDVFHVSGVHFVVAVSEEALLNFERRGYMARDAFDSAFDTIIRIGTPSAEDSLAMIRARSPEFPVILGAFCFAWAGGLPRDTLRLARRCVEIYESEAISELSTLMEECCKEDLVSALDASLDSSSEGVALRSDLVSFRTSFVRSHGLTTPYQEESLRAIADSLDVPIVRWLEALDLARNYIGFLVSEAESSDVRGRLDPRVIETSTAVSDALAQRGESRVRWSIALAEAIERCRTD